MLGLFENKYLKCYKYTTNEGLGLFINQKILFLKITIFDCMQGPLNYWACYSILIFLLSLLLYNYGYGSYSKK